MLGTMNLLPGFSFLTLETRHVSLFFLTNFVLVGAGRPIYAAAWNSAIHRSVNMNRLIALGTLAAFGYSTANLFSPNVWIQWNLAINGHVEGIIGIADTLRPESKEAIQQLTHAGLDVKMLMRNYHQVQKLLPQTWA